MTAVQVYEGDGVKRCNNESDFHELCAKLGMSQAFLEALDNGHQRIKGVEALRFAAKAMGIDSDNSVAISKA
jgi:hypothetical protein